MACTLQEMVLQAAALYKDRNAVCFQPYNKTPLYYTYQDVLQRAEELTLFLKCHNLENKTVGLYCQPGINLPSWILGILQVPAAYTPLDPTAPSSYTSSLIQRCKVQHVLVEKDKAEMFKLHPDWIEKDSSSVQHLHVTLFEVVRSDTSDEAEATHEAAHIPSGGDCTENEDYINIQDKQCLGYVLHTSGTTGIPKVVSVPHCCIVPNILHLRANDSVPLGDPLDETMIEVRNDDGVLVEEGEGQVYLGGRQRVCFLDDEMTLPYGTMRRTGDWVKIQDGNIFFIGRKDNQIKRHGKRLNTEYIQQVVDKLEPVDSCAVVWYQAKQLVLFVVLKKPLEKKSLWRYLQAHLLSYTLPDDLVVVDRMPLTTHGKIDHSRLNVIYCEHLQQKMDLKLPVLPDDLWCNLQDLWKSVLGLPEECSDISEDSVFLLSGGDSLKAIRFHEEVEKVAGRSVPGLLEVILSDTFLDIHRCILRGTSPVMENLQDQTSVNATESHIQHIVDVTENYLVKRKAEAPTLQMDAPSFVSLSRGNRLFLNVCRGGRDQKCEVIHGLSQDLLQFIGCNISGPKRQRTKLTPSPEQVITLQERWTSDTGKCVDASPLLVISSEKDSTGTVYIGSHSHRLQALDLDTGAVLWERILGDRIESSAAVSKCGKFILVGCYDGAVYVLRRRSGETHWVFTTGSAVKSSPAVDPVSGLAFIGSHDQYLYALDINVKQCVWKAHCQGGAVFSSPCVSTSPHHLYVATLGGRLLALDPVTGKNLWMIDMGKPMFSSPTCNQHHVFIGCVDANLYCFTHMGEKLWQFPSDGPIFSSPCMSPLSKHITFGSHDGFIYCCTAEAELLWKYKTSSQVYATPFTFPNPHTGNAELLAAASTDGNVWILDALSGLLVSRCALGGEVFSSPGLYGTRLVVGCRNNLVYCLDLIWNEK
ncbi:beta-alanine-activating enzyme isoform X2 [Engystomops pustulosus]|uniref:beta-alanine-activating enzyme isoform X2 n=1 Tax=Engystomops pustulosus TaxID=76066 RepID=UPI003AFB2646